MRSALRNFFLAQFVAAGLGCASSPDDVRSRTSAIVGGSADAEFAAVFEDAIVHIQAGRLRCSGTLVADNVVLTAVHCVVQNNDGWSFDGEAFEPVATEEIVVRVGANSASPRCELSVTELRTHPSVRPRLDMGFIEYDFAALVLSESAAEECGGIAPIDIDIREGIQLDDEVLLAGFGFLDEAQTMTGVRRFAPMAIVDLAPAIFVFQDTGAGIPAPGDSGGPMLMRDDEGELRIVGVMSTYLGELGTAAYLPGIPTFITDVIGPHQVCPGGGPWAVCEGDDVLACESGSYRLRRCAVERPCATSGSELPDCQTSPMPDAGTDAGTAETDAGTDALVVPDAETSADAGSRADAGLIPAAPVPSGCGVAGESPPTPWLLLFVLGIARLRRPIAQN